MKTRFAAALLVSTSLMTGLAAAQTSSTAPPATSTAASGKFVTEQTSGEYRASKFVGLNVYGSDNQKIGDINEILLDGHGMAKAVVIGVGGFLGIGEKNVAVPFASLEWVNTRPMPTGAANGSNMPAATGAPMTAGVPATTAPTTGGQPTTATGAPMAGAPAGTSTGAQPMAAGSNAPARSPAEQAAYNGYPDHAKVQLTKADLQNAPAFKYYSDTHTASGAPSNANRSGAAPVAAPPR